MTNKVLIVILLLFCAGSIFALTGFAESGVFAITAETLPVELSSFTALPLQNSYVQLDWITQSETGVSGYYIYRNSTNDLDDAMAISTLVTATNSSAEQSYRYIDTEVEPGVWYYWLQNVDLDGQVAFHGSISVNLSDNDGDDGTPSIPNLTALNGIYPNPFNPVTTISFNLAKAEQVTLDIYNVKGAKVRTLDAAHLNEGSYRRSWNGKDDNGTALSSGIYFLRMTAGLYQTTAKLVLMK